VFNNNNNNNAGIFKPFLLEARIVLEACYFGHVTGRKFLIRTEHYAHDGHSMG
jgi:hypothetical protein